MVACCNGSSSHLGDARILMRVTHFDLLLVGPDVSASPEPVFQALRASLPIMELGNDFSTRDAGEAGDGLLKKIQARLNPNLA